MTGLRGALGADAGCSNMCPGVGGKEGLLLGVQGCMLGGGLSSTLSTTWQVTWFGFGQNAIAG
jgi:hypothetical protein